MPARASQDTVDLLRFYLLGDLELFNGAQRLALPPRRTLGLLARILLQPRPLNRRTLAVHLFANQNEDAARRRLSDLLWVLQQALPTLPLTITRTDVHVPADARWLDVEAVRATLDQPERWQELLALYRGELLAGYDDDWIEGERSNLHAQVVRALERTARRLLAADAAPDAARVAQRLIAEEPYAESGTRLLMEAYVSLGERSKALAAYEQYAARLRAQVQVDPLDELRVWARQLRNGSADAAPLPHLPTGGDAQELVQRARQALDHADLATAQVLLERLDRLRAPATAQAVALLHFDRAMLDDDFASAESWLNACPETTSAVLWRRAALAVERGDVDGALRSVSAALLQAHQERDKSAELTALIILANVQQRRGQPLQGISTAEKAQQLAEQLGDALGVVRATVMRALILLRHQRPDEAAHGFREAARLARAGHFPNHFARAVNGLGIVYSDRGALTEARALHEQAVAVWHDTGLALREAHGLHNLSLIDIQLGRYADAQRAIEQARRLYQRLRNRLGLAICAYGTALVWYYEDEGRMGQAAQLLRDEMIPLARAAGDASWEASGWVLLGEINWVLGRFAAGLDACRQAEGLYAQLGRLDAWPSLYVYKGLAHLGLGDTAQADADTARALLAAAQGTAVAEDMPDIYYGRALVLEAQGRAEEARANLQRAHDALCEQAQQLDESARRTVFRRSPVVRRLMKDVLAHAIAAPEPGVVLRRLAPLRGTRPVLVLWTVDAGSADSSFGRRHGAPALRRHRLARLRREARQQGAAPLLSDYAAALGVSVRTVQRDLSALDG